MADVNFLTDDDVEVLKQILHWFRSRQLTTTQRPAVSVESVHVDPNSTPETYLALTPFTGIYGPDRTGPSESDPYEFQSAECEVYQLLESGLLAKVDGLTKRVYNISLDPITGSTLVDIRRDKWGTWFATGGTGVQPPTGTGTGTGTGTDGTYFFECGLLEDNHVVTVDVAALAGDGLGVDTGGLCDTLYVKIGCSLRIDNDRVQVDVPAIAGLGLSPRYVPSDTPEETCAVLDVAVGCHLTYTAGGLVAVDTDSLAGDNTLTSLVVGGATPGTGCPPLAVDLEVAEVDNEDLVNDVSLQIRGSTLVFTKTKSYYVNEYNAAGLHINRYPRLRTTTVQTFDLCEAYDCCTYYDFYGHYGDEVVAGAEPFAGEAPLEVYFTVDPQGGTVYWDFDDGGFSTDQSPTHTYTEPGFYLVKVYVYHACGVSVTMLPIVVAEVCGCRALCNGEDVTAITFSLTPGGTGEFATVPTEWVLYPADGCNFYWYQDGWLCTGAPGPLMVLRFDGPDGQSFTLTGVPLPSCCDLQSSFTLTHQSGTGTPPTVDVSGASATPCSPCELPDCCEGLVPDTLYVTFAGALASLGTVTFTKVLGLWSASFPAGTDCGLGNGPINLSCSGGSTWTITCPGPNAVFDGSGTAARCLPFEAELSGTSTNVCAGAFTASVRSVHP